jgi:hypothetical protein
MSFEPRKYQEEISTTAKDILTAHKIVILSLEVRTGKTFISLMTCQKMQYKNVLFVTKKKAIPSIEKDYKTLSPSFKLTVINFESLHKLDDTFDCVIVDESHSIGAIPKPSLRTKLLKKIVTNDLILMSGTLTPENYSQIFHQLWISKYSPFTENNFYKWAKVYINVKQRHLSHGIVNDYSEAYQDKILEKTGKLMISYTQEEAGFISKVNETVLHVEMKPITYQLISKLKKDLVLISKDGKEVIADTAVKLMQKMHQLHSGTVLFEDGSFKVIDNTKAIFIRDNFKGKRLGIFYKFKAELQALQDVLGEDLCTDVATFNTGYKYIALQIVSTEGINLSQADALVYYNIDFSAKNYFQSRDRLNSINREQNNVYWIFSKNGIEDKIYERVLQKKSFTLNNFKKL